MDRKGAPRVHLILIIVALLCVAAGTLFVITALRDTDPIGAKATILAAVHRHLGAGRQEPDVVDYGAIYRWTNAPSEVVIPRYMRWIIGFAVAGVVIGLGSVRWLRREVETKSLRLARANEELRQTEETLRLALEATKDGVWNAHLPTGEVRWNASAYTMLGYEPSEFPLTVKRWARLVHPDDRDVAWSIAAGQAYSGDGSVSAELRAQRRDGRWMWVHVRGKAIEWDSQGGVVRLTGTVSDITERKKAEAERERLLDHIQAQARQVQQIIDTVPDGVVLIDATGAVQLANPAAARLLPILTGQARPQSAGPAQPAPAVLGPITHLGDHALEQLLTPLAPDFWRAPTDNDRGNGMAARHTVWREAAVRREVRGVTVRREVDGNWRVLVSLAYPAAGETVGTLIYTFTNAGQIRVAFRLEPTGKGLPALPRIGMTAQIPAAFDRVTWLGRGPHENYADRRESAFVGRYDLPADDFFFPYVEPGEAIGIL